ncbi:hypothetical protein DSO57_1033067 [Entomophthora muscae]|uniref:Uncharacterized protein n=1 Tax=Entomophthora muscae TaxID=34485 RepID=A0ACC2TC66_9FUNG|nr:hypothetical protein DSO57_1033067 [Entomophthora muscae]
MIPAPGFASKSKNPGEGKSPLPASPAWWLGAGLIPVWGLKSVTFVTPMMSPTWKITRSPGLNAPLPAVYCPPGSPFGSVHFMEYPLNPEYKEYILEKILEQDPLACVISAAR